MPTSPLFQPLKPDPSVTCAKTNEGAGVEQARKETIPTHNTNVKDFAQMFGGFTH